MRHAPGRAECSYVWHRLPHPKNRPVNFYRAEKFLMVKFHIQTGNIPTESVWPVLAICI